MPSLWKARNDQECSIDETQSWPSDRCRSIGCRANGTVAEADDELGPQLYGAAAADDEAHDNRVSSSQRQEIDQRGRAFACFERRLQDQRSVAIAPLICAFGSVGAISQRPFPGSPRRAAKQASESN